MSILSDDPNFHPDYNLPPMPVGSLKHIVSTQAHDTPSAGTFLSPPTTQPLVMTLSGQTRLPVDSAAEQHHTFLITVNTHGSLNSPGNTWTLMPQDVDDAQSSQTLSVGFTFDGSGDEWQAMRDDVGFQIDENGNVQDTQVDIQPNIQPTAAPAIAGSSRLASFEVLEAHGHPNESEGIPAIPSTDHHLGQLDMQTEVRDTVVVKGSSAHIMSDTSSDPEWLPAAEETAKTKSKAHAKAKSRRHGRGLEKLIRPDLETKVSIEEYTRWNRDYVVIQNEARERAKATKLSRVTAAQVRESTWNTMFGAGIMGVGTMAAFHNVPDHPLAQMFSGKALEESVLSMALGRPIKLGSDSGTNSKVRSASAALSDHEGRRTRRRLSDEDGGEDSAAPEVEVGREHPDVPDVPSDVVLPWNHSSFLQPPLAQESSPILNTKGIANPEDTTPLRLPSAGVSSIERYSDQPLPALGSDDPAPALPGSSPEPLGDFVLDAQSDGDSSHSTVAAGRLESFLLRIKECAREKGGIVCDNTDNGNNHWVSFSALIPEDTASKKEATAAFYNVLELTSRSYIKVEQVAGEADEPLGGIRIGVMIEDADGSNLAPGEKRASSADLSEEMPELDPSRLVGDHLDLDYDLEGLRRRFNELAEEYNIDDSD